MENEIIDKTFISQRGYGLLKSQLNYKELNNIKDELTVSPKTMNSFGNSNPTRYNIYTESTKKIYVPKYYGLQKFGKPDVNKLLDGVDVNLKFKGELRENQVKPVDRFLEAARDPLKMGGLINLSCAAGKCMGIDTPIIMYDGTIKKIQDIKVGDKLMGDDSRHRNVLSLARGSEMMYDVIPEKGDKYNVNESHILSVISSTNISKKIKKGTIIDIPLLDYLKLPKPLNGKYNNHLLGYRVGVEFPYKKIDIEPYILGYWLGSGVNTNMEGLYDNCKDKQEGVLFNMLRNHKLIMNKHIPDLYKCNSRKVRLELLAGIIDSCGCLDKNGYDIIDCNEKLLDDIIYLSRSLGFASYKNECEKNFIYEGEKKLGIYYRTYIHGRGVEKIPIKCDKKKISKIKNKINALNTRIRIEKKGINNYYGFTLDGNHRYLLGDFQVTHNTVMALNIISKLKKKTLVVVHKDFLLKQWKERIEEFLPTARVGLLKAKVIDIEDKDIVMASLQSLSMKEYDKGTFDEFGLMIGDEIHNFAAEVFSRALFKINFKYSLGLSATMTRKDGLSKVFKWHIGDIVYKNNKKKIDNVNVECYEYYNENQLYSREVTLPFNNKPNMARMINNICEFDDRIDYIANIVKNIKQKEKNRNILLLSDRRGHLKELKQKIENIQLDNSECGYYVGGMKDKELKYTEDKCDIILATFSMASEGLDLPKLDSVILCSPKSSIEQSVGRILRKKIEDRTYIPLIIDIIDNFSMFINQSKKRIKYYKKCDYNISHIKSKKTIKDETNEIKLEGKCMIK